ncbi:MAG: DUF2752 domain-containing protein [Phycisphaerales bacterium]
MSLVQAEPTPECSGRTGGGHFPDPPLVSPVRATVGERFIAAVVAVFCLSLLIVAANLRPDPRGVETHTQLGLWPCGWYLASGVPCPTCGMTTAVAAAANGSYFTSLRTQPFGFIMALAAAVSFWAGMHVAWFGSRLWTVAGRLFAPRLAWALAVMLLGAWVYKIAVMKSG